MQASRHCIIWVRPVDPPHVSWANVPEGGLRLEHPCVELKLSSTVRLSCCAGLRPRSGGFVALYLIVFAAFDRGTAVPFNFGR